MVHLNLCSLVIWTPHDNRQTSRLDKSCDLPTRAHQIGRFARSPILFFYFYFYFFFSFYFLFFFFLLFFPSPLPPTSSTFSSRLFFTIFTRLPRARRVKSLMEGPVIPASISDSVLDVPFDVSISLAPPRVNKAAATTTLDFDGLLKEPLLLKEDLKDGCGGQLWPAGMVLAQYLLRQHSTDLFGKTMWVISRRF